MSHGLTTEQPLDTDVTLSFDSDYIAASQHAVKTFVENSLNARLSAANATDLTDGGETALHSHAGGGATIDIVTSDPLSPADGELWLLRTSAAAHADGEAMGPLGLTYTGDAGIGDPLQLSVNDQGTTRRLTFV